MSETAFYDDDGMFILLLILSGIVGFTVNLIWPYAASFLFLAIMLPKFIQGVGRLGGDGEKEEERELRREVAKKRMNQYIAIWILAGGLAIGAINWPIVGFIVSLGSGLFLTIVCMFPMAGLIRRIVQGNSYDLRKYLMGRYAFIKEV